VRWDNLLIEAEAGTTLPGYREPAVVRTFDAPEALDTRFYEVRAKSALNRVPPQSQVPFRWTVNPYRGCTHACTYCLSPDTPVLCADGRQRAIGALAIGEEVVGTERRGSYRRFVTTEVRDRWETVKPAFRVVLADGTELIASGDHRFLTGRGWKHVIGADQGRDRRPHLTLGSELLGVGQLAEGPCPGIDYRRGYVTGMVRGDAHLSHYSYDRPGRSHGDVYRFRLALADTEALERAESFLSDTGIATKRFVFLEANGRCRRMDAIRTQRKAHFDAITDLVSWPLDPSDEWCRGFLAGIFDAEGSCSRGVLRVANGDDMILRWTQTCFARFGFSTVREGPRSNGVSTVRLRGGMVEQQRFFQLTDPAITRKRSLVGRALKNAVDLRVVSIEPVGTHRLVDITTGTGDFIANGVVSHNCFARPTHTYLGFDAGRDFDREIVVKVNAPEALRADLRKPSWKREHVALGTNTDPYQWVEGRYELLPGIWRALLDSATPCSVLTKSPLLLRDLALFQELVAGPGFTASLSIPTLDEKAWRATEPRTPNPRARIEAVAALNQAGVPTGVLIAPLMPGINDAPEQVERILELCREAGAVSIGGIPLHLRGETRRVFLDWLRSTRPDLVTRYEEIYARSAYGDPAERARLQRLIGTDGDRTWRQRIAAQQERLSLERAPLPMAAVQQETLF
jgi:DNA repair photolyase